MIENLYKTYLQSSGVSTDTRTIEKDNIWFALKGPNFNANSFADQAIEKGALAVVIDDDEYAKDDRYVVVTDVLVALQELANHHRHQLSIPVLAITGSNGKTTTKELIRDVLLKKYKVSATKGNLNNHIGVPLSLLAIDDSVEFAVIEMGANAQGEIKMLCNIAEPDFGLITNIGKAHLEGFGGIEGVFKGKTEMYDFLAKTGGKAFVNTNFEKLVEKLDQLGVDYTRYPNPGDDLVAILEKEKPQLEITAHDQKFTTTLTGGYNFSNIAVALCVGEYFGVSSEAAIKAVKSYDPDNNRSQLMKRGSNTFIMDAYNANPSSMKEALLSFDKREAQRKVIIIGDMLELGEESRKEHEGIGELTTTLSQTEVHLCGPEMEAAKSGNPKANYWDNKQDLAAFLQKQTYQNTLFLIKGSRGMSLETLLNVL